MVENNPLIINSLKYGVSMDKIQLITI